MFEKVVLSLSPSVAGAGVQQQWRDTDNSSEATRNIRPKRSPNGAHHCERCSGWKDEIHYWVSEIMLFSLVADSALSEMGRTLWTSHMSRMWFMVIS